MQNFEWTNELVAEYGQFYHSAFNNPIKYMPLDIMDEFIKIKRSPIFITEDNVRLFEKSEKVIAVKIGEYKIFDAANGDTIGTWLNGWYAYHLSDKSSDSNYLHMVKEYIKVFFKLFSRKEAAEEYILMNKPVLSINDLLSVWNHPVDISNENKESPLLSRFKELAKSKLNP